MDDNLLHYLYAQLACSIVFNLVFGALFIRKIRKLDQLAEDLEVSIPRIVWIKFIVILILIGLLLLHLILAYSSTAYWLNSWANFSLVIFLYVANYTMQGYIILKQISRGNQARFLPNIFFWAISVVALIIQIVVVEVTVIQILDAFADPKLHHDSSTYHLHTKLHTCPYKSDLLEKKSPSARFDKYSVCYKDSLNERITTSRSIEHSVRFRQRITAPNRLYIQFNKDFQVNPHSQGILCLFKIAVYVDENTSIIRKTDLQFMKLEKEMIKMFPHRQQVLIPQQTVKFSNMMKYGQQKQKMLENYLLQLAKSGEFVVPILLDFLQVPNALRSRLTFIERPIIVKQDTSFTEQLQKMRKPFFRVYAHNGKYILENPDFLEFIINRPLNEILQLHNRLKQQNKLTIDVLPQNPKEQDIISFFQIIVNKKNLWRPFCAWFRLDILLENKVYNFFDPWTYGFKKITVQIVGHQIIFDKEGKIHTCYLISIKHKGKASMPVLQLQPRGTIIKKRYSDFCNLDKHIRKFIAKNNPNFDVFPALPPKFSPFGSKTSPKSRQMRLGSYIRQLIAIEGINQCIKLLQFLQFDSKVEVSQQMQFSHGLEQDESEPSYFNDLE